jgi:hypothetical protein
MIDQITQAIKNFDVASLKELLDDNKTYQDVSKSLFLKKLKKKFNQAKRDDCHSFDDVFFGICGSCNKGCEGMTFLSNSGYYLDLFIESKDSKTVDDIYVCNKLTNFTDLEKSMDLGFSFYKDEYLLFKPSTEYTLIKQQYKLLKKESKDIESPILLDELVDWYSDYDYLSNTIDRLSLFAGFDYKLYGNAFDLVSQFDNILKMKAKADQATEALINYHLAKTEREQLVWFYENQNNHYGTVYFKLSKSWRKDSIVTYKSDTLKLKIDISGYEYVMDYLEKLDALYDHLMEKYQPLPEHFEQSETGGIEYSLENHLRLHNKYLDVIEKYERKKK